MNYEEYPTWEEIKNDISRVELQEIIAEALIDNDIQEVMYSYIQSNYEPKIVLDEDYAYELYREGV